MAMNSTPNISPILEVLFNFHTLSSYVAMGRSRIYSLIDEGDFPPPIKIGRSSRWIKAEIDAWIDEQAAARRTVD
jgi:predicted DNA-binding transcriptional regulator AlpA